MYGKILLSLFGIVASAAMGLVSVKAMIKTDDTDCLLIILLAFFGLIGSFANLIEGTKLAAWIVRLFGGKEVSHE